MVAGRLAEAYRRPAVAMSMPTSASTSGKEKTVVASGRSIPQFDIEEAFGSAQHLLVKYGGHSQAAGFTVTQENLPQVISVLSQVAEKELADCDLRPALEIDAEVRFGEFTEGAIQWLSQLEPFGKANPRPLFLSQGVEVLELRTMGNASQHVKLSLGQEGKVMTALAFNQAQDWPQGATHLDIVYTITADWWRGVKSDNLKVVDVRPSAR